MKRHMLGRVIMIGGVILASGCAAQSKNAAAVPEVEARDRNVLTGEEMERAAGDGADVYEAIAKLRPHFLRQRSALVTGKSKGIPVYVGNTPYGGIDALKGLRPMTVRQVRYLNGSEATMSFGTGHAEGALVLTLR